MTQVLIVDDDRAIRELLLLALEMEGYTATALSDGGPVVETLEAACEPRIVLLDVMMPGVDGLEVCRRLAERPELAARHRVIVMTACPPLDGEPPEPAVALIAKPFQLAQLLRLIESLERDTSVPGAGPAPAAPAPYSPLSLAS